MSRLLWGLVLTSGALGVLVGFESEGSMWRLGAGLAMGTITGLCIGAMILGWPNLDAGPSD